MAKDAVTEAFVDSLNQVQPWEFNLASPSIVNGRVLRQTPGMITKDNTTFYDVVILDAYNDELDLNETGTGNPLRPYLAMVRSSNALTAGSKVQVSRGVAVSGAVGEIESGDTEDYIQFCPSGDHKILSSGGGASCFQSYTEWGAFFG